MLGSKGATLLLVSVAFPGRNLLLAQRGPNHGCETTTLSGEVKAGQAFSRPIGKGLQFSLEPIHSGWIVRVYPAAGPRANPDYAEVATPPYRSLTPLSLSTDFAFRAQDAVGWNPRGFRFALTHSSYAGLLEVYRETATVAPGGAMPGAATRLGQLLASAGSGRLRVLDARLIPGMADQGMAAAAVASHFSSTAHTLQDAPAGRPDQLGQLLWVRFQVDLRMPQSGPDREKVAAGCTF